MKASRKLDSLEWHGVVATLKEGKLDYTAVINSKGQLMAWGYAGAVNMSNEWIWVHKNFRD